MRSIGAFQRARFLYYSRRLSHKEKLYIRFRWGGRPRRRISRLTFRLGRFAWLSTFISLLTIILLPMHLMAFPAAIGAGVSVALLVYGVRWRRLFRIDRDELLLLDLPDRHESNPA